MNVNDPLWQRGLAVLVWVSMVGLGCAFLTCLVQLALNRLGVIQVSRGQMLATSLWVAINSGLVVLLICAFWWRSG